MTRGGRARGGGSGGGREAERAIEEWREARGGTVGLGGGAGRGGDAVCRGGGAVVGAAAQWLWSGRWGGERKGGG